MDILDAYFSTVIQGERCWVGPGCEALDGEWWVVSGENPMDERLDDAANAERHRALGEALGGAEVVCRGAGGWVERSWVVQAPWEVVLREARRYVQRAVFRLDGAWVEVVMTSGGRDGEVVGRRDRAWRAAWEPHSGGRHSQRLAQQRKPVE